jgi:hypothetical protein
MSALTFYDYRKQDIIAPDDTIIGETKIRFPEMVIQAQQGALPTAILCVEKVKKYKDEDEISTRLPNVTVSVTPEFLAETFNLYNGITGEAQGAMDYGTGVSVLYSIERALFERAEALALVDEMFIAGNLL